MGKMSRQQRRQRDRDLRKYETKSTFTKGEIERANEVSYRYGMAFALQASKEVLGLGDTRLERIREKIAEYEARHFGQLEEFTELDITKRRAEK